MLVPSSVRDKKSTSLPTLRSIDSVQNDPNRVRKRTGPVFVAPASSEINLRPEPKIKLNPFLFLNEEEIEAKRKKTSWEDAKRGKLNCLN